MADLRPVLHRTPAVERCWPAGLRIPIDNRGRDFTIEVATDGRITSAAVTPGSAEPRAFSSCVVRLLERTTLRPTGAGETIDLRISLGIENPVWYGRRGP